MKQYDDSMKISEIKKDMRITIMNEITDFLRTKYEVVGNIESNKIGVAMGTYKDQFGFENDTSCSIQVSAKPFYDKEPQLKKDGQMSREIKTFDLISAIENYKNGVEE